MRSLILCVTTSPGDRRAMLGLSSVWPIGTQVSCDLMDRVVVLDLISSRLVIGSYKCEQGQSQPMGPCAGGAVDASSVSVAKAGVLPQSRMFGVFLQTPLRHDVRVTAIFDRIVRLKRGIGRLIGPAVGAACGSWRLPAH